MLVCLDNVTSDFSNATEVIFAVCT